jgi:L,D-transpeptidase catalytic domain
MRILSKVLVVCAILLAGCAPDRDAVMNRFISRGALVQQGTENGDEISYWDGTGSGGEARIVIDLDQQRAYFYKGDQIVGVSAVSTGREGYDTPPGEFRIMEKDREHVSSLYGNYVDQSGQVVMENVEADKDPRPRGTIFRGSTHAILPQNRWRHWHTRRLSARLSGVTWLYSVARENGTSIFSKCCCRHPR